MNDVTAKLAEALRAQAVLDGGIGRFFSPEEVRLMRQEALCLYAEAVAQAEEARTALAAHEQAQAATPAPAAEQQGDKWGAFGYLRKTNSKDNPPHGWAFHFAGRPGDVAVWTTQAPPKVEAATPAQAEPQPLTDEQIDQIIGLPGCWTGNGLGACFKKVEFARAIERAHGIGQGKEASK